ncbi:hypothetical protein ACTFIU_001342 [Dictyostelium citrinum]
MYSNFTGKGNNDSPFSKPKMPTPGSSIKQPPFNHGPSSLNNPMNGNPSPRSPYRTSLIQKPPIVNRNNNSFDIHSPPPQPLVSNSTLPQKSSQSIQDYMNTPLPHKRSGFTHPTSFPQSSSSLTSTSSYSFSSPTTRTTAPTNINKTTTTISTTTSPPLPSNINKTTTTTTSPTLPSNINKTTTTTTTTSPTLPSNINKTTTTSTTISPPTLPSNINKTTTISTTASPTFSNSNKLLQVSRGLDASQPTLRNTLNIFTSKPTTTTTTTTTTSTTNINGFNYNENSNNIYNSNTQSNNNSNNFNKSKLFKKEQEFITSSQVFLPDENDPSYALILQMMQEDIMENDDREMAKRLGGELDGGGGGFLYDGQSRTTTNSFYNEYETEEDDYSGGNDYEYSGGHNINDIDLSYENLVQLEPVVVGASKKQIESVEETLYLDPVGRNKQQNYKNTQGHDTRCAICLCDFESNDLIKILPKCKHLYHSECIDPWFKASKFCPQCKVEL